MEKNHAIMEYQSVPLPETEEVIFTGYDKGWHRDLPVKLITYKDGSQDLHRQTGPQFKDHVAQARRILNERGLDVRPDAEFFGPTGAYLTVSKMRQPTAALAS